MRGKKENIGEERKEMGQNRGEERKEEEKRGRRRKEA